VSHVNLVSLKHRQGIASRRGHGVEGHSEVHTLNESNTKLVVDLEGTIGLVHHTALVGHVDSAAEALLRLAGEESNGIARDGGRAVSLDRQVHVGGLIIKVEAQPVIGLTVVSNNLLQNQTLDHIVAVAKAVGTRRGSVHNKLGTSGALITDISKVVVVKVSLVGVLNQTAVVKWLTTAAGHALLLGSTAVSVLVNVVLGIHGTHITSITNTISVNVVLGLVVLSRAVVTVIAEAVTVAVGLVSVGKVHAVVAGISNTVTVRVGRKLSLIKQVRAVVTDISVGILVPVGLVSVGIVNTVVTGVTNTITVRVGLVLVVNLTAVVISTADAVTVRVVHSVLGAGVTLITVLIIVAVELMRVEDVTAVVVVTAEAIADQRR